MHRAVLIMLVAMSLIPLGDSAGKLMTSTMGISPIFVAWSRFALGTLMVLPFLSPGTLALFRDWRVWLRAAILACGITAIQTALQTADVATVFAAFFVGPLFSYVLAVIFLREPATPLRSLLICIGFGGVLLVVRPGMSPDPGVLWAVTAGLCYGAFLTMSRWLTGVGTPIALTFSQLSIAALLMLPWGLISLPAPDMTVAALTLVSAACSMLGNLLLLYAYRISNATRLAPLVYFQLIAAVGLGWSIFGALPDAYTWAGLAVILISGIVSTRLR